jgi:tRNA A-37 threonylcarbamoyl transferase component Bud32
VTTATDPTATAYTVRALLARGGMAIVELATDRSGRLVAVKRVALTGAADDIARSRARVRREAAALATVRHPGIVPLLAVEDDGSDLVLVMPYLAGGNLAQRVARRGPLPAAEVERMASLLLGALAVAHRAGIVHRDITPANILFDEHGRPVLADFGIAASPVHTIGLTRDGLALGTPGFMPPEQARGEPAQPASDVFGLGACLFFALTGESPYGVGSPDVLGWRAARGQVRSLPASVPGAFRRTVAAMLDADPRRRPDPAGVGIKRPRPRSRRWRTGAWTAAVTGVTALLVGGSLLVASRPGDGRLGPGTGQAAAAPVAALPPCAPLPYRPCGQAVPAPFTDGRSCTDGHADYDGDAANGCEAAPDGLGGSVLDAEHPLLLANLVPADQVDTYRAYVSDHPQLFCDGRLTIRLTAPAGVADRIEVVRSGVVLASAISENGHPAEATVDEPSCLHDDSGWLLVRVSSVASRTAAPYRLEQSGSF